MGKLQPIHYTRPAAPVKNGVEAVTENPPTFLFTCGLSEGEAIDHCAAGASEIRNEKVSRNLENEEIRI